MTKCMAMHVGARGKRCARDGGVDSYVCREVELELQEVSRSWMLEDLSLKQRDGHGATHG